jgi:hypothetical protein
MKMFNFNSSRRRRWMVALALLTALLLLLAVLLANAGKGTTGPRSVNEPTVVPEDKTPTVDDNSKPAPPDSPNDPGSREPLSTDTTIASNFTKGRSFQVEFAQIQPPRADAARWNLLKQEVYNLMTVTGSLEYRGFLGGGVGPKDDTSSGGVMMTPVVETQEDIYSAEIFISGSGVQGIEHYLSNDGGATWQRIDLSSNPSAPVFKVSFPTAGNKLRYKAVWPAQSKGLLVEVSVDINTFGDFTRIIEFPQPVQTLKLLKWANLPPGTTISVNGLELPLGGELRLPSPTEKLVITMSYDAQAYFAPPAGPATIQLVAE